MVREGDIPGTYCPIEQMHTTDLESVKIDYLDGENTFSHGHLFLFLVAGEDYTLNKRSLPECSLHHHFSQHATEGFILLIHSVIRRRKELLVLKAADKRACARIVSLCFSDREALILMFSCLPGLMNSFN